MLKIKNTGLVLFLIGMMVFIGINFMGEYQVKESAIAEYVESNGLKSKVFIEKLKSTCAGKSFSNSFTASQALTSVLNESNEYHKTNEEWDQVIYKDAHKDVAFTLMKKSSSGAVANSPFLFFLLTFGLGILGGLMYIVPDLWSTGPPGIRNNGLFLNAATNKGWIAWIAFAFFVGFYVVLYFFPEFLINLTTVVDGFSQFLKSSDASQWFLYGFIYCVVMLVMGVRMMIKYRHNRYQMFRTTVVVFFQIGFAFLIPEIMAGLNMPSMDFKNAWPLNYSFFFDWNLNSLMEHGTLGVFMIFWGILLTLIIVPVMVYFFGKRWYCSWVCGCGGLAETLGDPYRQLSDKSVKSWKIERWLIHSVLVFAVVMTAVTLYTYFTGESQVLGLSSYDVRDAYGFLIGSIFSGVIGTGFYPVLGNRVWCRFGCPLAAYMGIVQRFKSRFRITVNGGQCISCGNCSTYCEMGIDVRAYAQKGQNVVRASCVGCGICAAVCPRGVLKLENTEEMGRVKPNPVLTGHDSFIKVETNSAGEVI